MSELSYPELRTQLIQAARMLFQATVMSHSGHGNLSVRVPGTDHLLITATGQIRDLAARDQLRAGQQAIAGGLRGVSALWHRRGYSGG